MLRYLEANYLDEFIIKKNSFLQQCQLTVPFVECRGRKADSLATPSELFRQMDEKSLQGSFSNAKNLNDIGALEDEFQSLKHVSLSNNHLPEKFTFPAAIKKNQPVIDVIPSSSPESVDSFDGIMLDEFEEEVKDYVLESIADAGSDDARPLEFIDAGEILLLEEQLTLCDDLVHSYSARELRKKLKPAKLSDPFAESFDREVSLLDSDRKLAMPKQHGINELNVKDEDIEKIKHDTEDDDNCLFEEPCVLINDSCCLTKKCSGVDCLVDELEKVDLPSASEEEISFLQMDPKDVTLSVENLEMDKDKNDTSHSLKDPHLTLLIDTPVNEKEAITFESPLPSKVIGNEDDLVMPYEDISATMECHQISPLHQKHFISPSTKLKYEQSIREYDKYFEDILAMQLKVPVLVESKVTSRPLVNALDSAGLKKQDNDCHLEVNLAWDPLSSKSNVIDDSKKRLSKEMLFDKKKQESIKDPTNEDVKKLSLENIHDDAKLVREGLDALPYRSNNNDAKEINLPKQHEHKAKNTSATNTERREANYVRLDDYNYQKVSTTSLKAEAINRMNTSLKSNVVMQSPLDQFLLLRTGEKKVVKPFSNRQHRVALASPRNIVKAAKVKPSVFKTDQKSEKHNQSIVHGAKQKTPLTKGGEDGGNEALNQLSNNGGREIITIQLGDDLVKVLRKLEKDSRPLMGFLKGKNALSTEYSFFTLHSDVTRFLLRQQERKFGSCESNNNEDEDVLKGIVCLHALILAADAITNYGITTAIGVLKRMREEYENIIGAVLDPVRKHLVKEQIKFDSTSNQHPKMQKISSMIQDILQIPDRKVIILVRRYYECCFSMLQSSLGCVKNVVVKRYPKEASEEILVNNIIAQGNVIVAELSAELQFCPWNRFSFVFEFEFKKESEWYSVCYESNRKLQGFFAFNCSVPKDIEQKVFMNEAGQGPCMLVKPTTSQSERPLQCFSQHIIIGSTNITANKKLLCELENKFNITIIERDYSSIYKNLQTLKYHRQPDIVVDEQTCILLFNDGHNDTRERSVKQLEEKIASALLKCNQCHVIVCFRAEQCIRSFPHDLTEKLSTTVLQHPTFKNTDKNSTNVRLLYAFFAEQTAEHILNICNNARDTSVVWTQDEWGRRFWLTEEMSKHEQFLLSFPYFTSFSAQIMLTATSLKSALGFSLSEMQLALKWIPTRIIQAFHTAVNHSIFEAASDMPGHVFESDKIDESGRRRKKVQGILFDDEEMHRSDNLLSNQDTMLQERGVLFDKEMHGSDSLLSNQDTMLQGNNHQIGSGYHGQTQRSVSSSSQSTWKRWEGQDDRSNDRDSNQLHVAHVENYFGSGEMASEYFPCDSYGEKQYYITGDDDFNVMTPEQDVYTKEYNGSKCSAIKRQYAMPVYKKHHGEKPSQLVQGKIFGNGFDDRDFNEPSPYQCEYAYPNYLDKPSRQAFQRPVMQHNTCPQGFPQWKQVDASENSSEIERDCHYGRSRRSSKDRIVFKAIPKSIFQGQRSFEEYSPAITPPNRSIPLSAPSTIRLKPSKRRRLTYERNPNSTNGQTRLAFI
eukprot:gene7892-8746_t